MRVLTLNPGSSSMKVSLVVDGAAVGWAAWDLTDPAVGHPGDPPLVRCGRGRRSGSSTAARRRRRRWSTTGSCANLERLTSLAPNHQPLSLAVTREVRRLLPDDPGGGLLRHRIPRRMPEAAARYPLPRAWTAQNRLRRYGFHGLSCQYALRRTGRTARPAGRRTCSSSAPTSAPGCR